MRIYKHTQMHTAAALHIRGKFPGQGKYLEGGHGLEKRELKFTIFVTNQSHGRAYRESASKSTPAT